MDYTSDPSTNQHPDKHDYDELVTIYSHLDSSTTVGLVAPVSNHADAEDWGRLVSSVHDGRQEMYIKDHGGGDATVTFVTWAD